MRSDYSLSSLISRTKLYSMKIKEQTRKLAAGCSKHCFEVVDRTDEVSNIYMARRSRRGLKRFSKSINSPIYAKESMEVYFQEPLNGLFLKIPVIFIASSSRNRRYGRRGFWWFWNHCHGYHIDVIEEKTTLRGKLSSTSKYGERL